MDPSEPNTDGKDVQDEQNTEAIGAVTADTEEDPNQTELQPVQVGEGIKDAETGDSNGEKGEDADKKRSLEGDSTSEEPDATRPRLDEVPQDPQNGGAVSEDGKKPEEAQQAASPGDANANRMPPAANPIAPGVQMQPFPPFGGFPGGPEQNAAMQQHFFQQQFYMGQHPFVPGQGQMPMGMGGQFPMPQFMPPDQQQRFFQVPGQPGRAQQKPIAPGGAPGGPLVLGAPVVPQEGGGATVPEQVATPQGVPNPPTTENGAAPVQIQHMQQGVPPPVAPPGAMPQQHTGAPPGQGAPEAPLQPGPPVNQGGPAGMQPPGAQPGEQAQFPTPFGQFVGGRPPFMPGGMPGFMPPDQAFQHMMMQRGIPPEADAAFRQRMMAFGGMPPGAPGQFRQSFLAAGGGRINNMSAELRGLANLQPQSPAISLALACDDEHLSEYQILVRKQLEVFEAQPEDVESNTQGRKKQVSLGQVGMRCRHCAGLPLRQRGRGAVYYPAKLQGVYQAAQNMASSHLCEACQCIDESLKEELKVLRERRDTASGGKQYWADGARALGLVEAEDGLRLTVENSNNNQQQQQQQQQQAQQQPPQPQPPQQQQVQPQPPQPVQQT